MLKIIEIDEQVETITHFDEIAKSILSLYGYLQNISRVRHQMGI